MEKIKTRLGLMDRLQAWRASWRLWSDGPRGDEVWARFGTNGRRPGEKQVRLRSMHQQGHMMIWRGSYHLWYGWCMCCINDEGDGMECARQRYICRAFHFTGQRLCREVHDRVSNRRPYYEERQTYLHIGHLVPLEWSNFACMLGSSGVEKRVLILWKNICEKLTHVHKLVNTWWC